MNGQNCATCQCAIKSQTEMGQFTCHAFPPTVIGGVINTPQGSGFAVQSVWATVPGEGWCGVWEPRPVAPATP